MVKSYGRIQDYSAVENIERNNNETEKEDYDSRYTDEDLALLDSEAAARSEELERLREMQERLRQSAERGQAMASDTTGLHPLSEEERLARSEQRRKVALAELDKALAEARAQGQKGLQDTDSTATESHALAKGSIAVSGKVEINEHAVNEPAENAESEQVVKKIKTSSDYFNTLAENEPEPRLIKAIIDEDIKAVEGSRVRLRLLDDVEIDGKVVCKGSYLYATMSGFGSQRVKGSIKSLLVEDELIKVNLSLYDTDGLEGLYVPSSSFRETTQDVASNTLGSTMSINNGSTGNTFAQWGMQAIQNAYQRTSNALSKAVRKNKAKLKYGTFVYLVNGREKRNN